jgi:feruloyl esterase
VYGGKGDVNAAASYIRKPLATQPAAYHWLGEDFYQPFTFMN